MSTTTGKTFFFYDLETTGVDKAHDRIVQFAGQRTDAELKAVGPAIELYCQPPADVLPSIEATLIHRVSPLVAARRGSTEAVFAERLHTEFTTPQTCALGYNAMGFDHDFIRFLLYRNLRDPYRWAWAEGNSRWDLLDVMRAAHALRPEGITWPRKDNGKPSFRLEDLAAANGVEQRRAHDAISDVEALIGLGRLVHMHHRRLWDYALTLRNKHGVGPHLRTARTTPMLLVDGRIDAALGCTTAFINLGKRPGTSAGEVVWDLRRDPAPFVGMPVEALRARLFARRDALGSPDERPGLLTIHPGKSPFVVTSALLKDDALCARIRVDKATIRRHFRTLMAATRDADFGRTCREVYGGERPGTDTGAPVDVDARLYDGFFSDADRAVLNRVRDGALAGRSESAAGARDGRVPDLVMRYLGRNHPHLLDAQGRTRWDEHVRRRLHEPLTEAQGEAGESAFQRWWQELQGRLSAADRDDAPLLAELAEWGRRIAPATT